MRVALYVRVSTEDQKHDLQLHDLRRYAELRGFKIHKEYVDTMSGARDDRPGLEALMEDARKRRIDAVLVWRFDRFARSTKHLTLALDEFRTLGVQFLSYNENIDTSTPMGQAMFTIISAIAQLERDIIRQRIKAGVRVKRAGQSGVWGRHKGFDHEEARRLRGKGYSLGQIAKRMGVTRTSIFRVLKSEKA